MGFWSKFKSLTLGVVEEGLKMFPGGSVLSKGVRFLHHGVDRLKDWDIDTRVSGLSDQIGSLKDGLNGVNAKVEAQGKALRGEMEGMKTELENQLKQQGEKFDQDIKNLDAKIATLQGEQKKQAEEQRLALQ